MKQDTEMGEANNGYIGTPGTVPVSHAGNASAVRRLRTAGIVLRLAAMGLCVGALVTMVTDRQTHYFTIPVTNPPIILAKTAKYSSILVLVVYVWTNAAVAGYSLLQAVWTLIAKGYVNNRRQLWITFILDQLAVYTLLGVVGAATEVAYLAEKGEEKVQWAKTCQNFSRFCSQVGISVLLAFSAILALVFISAIAAKQLFSSDRLGRTVKKDGYYASS